MSVKKQIDKALEGLPIPAEAYLPPTIVGKRSKSRTTEEEREYIKIECDPVGQLIAIANGMPIPHFEVKDVEGKPTLTVRYETAKLSERIKILEGLKDKVISTVSRNAKEIDSDEDEWKQLTGRRGAQVLAGKSD